MKAQIKAVHCAVLLLALPLAHAQVFLDPEITRRAAETMVTGNIQLGNVQIGGGLQSTQAMPTAAEIAAEIRAQEQREKARREAAEREARRARVVSTLESAYKAEFRTLR